MQGNVIIETLCTHEYYDIDAWLLSGSERVLHPIGSVAGEMIRNVDCCFTSYDMHCSMIGVMNHREKTGCLLRELCKQDMNFNNIEFNSIQQDIKCLTLIYSHERSILCENSNRIALRQIDRLRNLLKDAGFNIRYGTVAKEFELVSFNVESIKEAHIHVV